MLGHLLSVLPAPTDPDVLVATETADDAGVYRIDPRRALVQTVDFFTPILDDPYDYGQVAAANALSDVYAMGGRPLTALAIVCFPEGDLEPDVLVAIMRGAHDKVVEAGATILGGHSVRDQELKFGLSVTGLVDPEHIVRNRGARPGDALVLTKPLGTGILSSGVKKGLLGDEGLRLLTATMAALNRAAAEGMAGLGVHAGTDITGFGLVGHARGMARASDVTLRIRMAAVPELPGARDLAARGCLTRGERTNAALVADVLDVGPGVTAADLSIIKDPQTSGGLLLALAPEDAATYVARLRERGVDASLIGDVGPGPARLRVERP